MTTVKNDLMVMSRSANMGAVRNKGSSNVMTFGLSLEEVAEVRCHNFSFKKSIDDN